MGSGKLFLNNKVEFISLIINLLKFIGHFSDMTHNETLRKIFVKSAADYIKKIKFDGLDLE